MTRYRIVWNRDALEWLVYRGAESVGAFTSLLEAERWCCGEGEVIDLDVEQVES